MQRLQSAYASNYFVNLGDDFENSQELLDYARTACERKPEDLTMSQYVDLLRRGQYPRHAELAPLRDQSLNSAVATIGEIKFMKIF